MEEKLCKLCGKKFFTQYNQQKYCSDECRDKTYKKHKITIKICPICQKQFIPNTSQKYCSKKCRNKNQNDYLKKIKQRKRKEKLKELKCPYCGKLFKQHDLRQKYCSIECQKKYARKKHAKKLKLNKPKQYELICKCCGKTFISNNRIRKYCSDTCSKIKQKELINKRDNEILDNGYKSHSFRQIKYSKKKIFFGFTPSKKNLNDLSNLSEFIDNRKKDFLHICQNCGKEFYAFSHLVKYDCEKCAKEQNNLTILSVKNKLDDIIFKEIEEIKSKSLE
jgi:hypothetical protein